MNIKSVFHNLTYREYRNLYTNFNIDSITKGRETDLNKQCINIMLNAISNSDASNLLDVGCGNGYWLNKLSEKTKLKLTGCDLYDYVPLANARYVKANIENLPFGDKTFDIVTCCHAIEHVIHLEKAVNELKRVASKQLILVTPCQRYYYYTLDAHINFFPAKYLLENLIMINNHFCKNLGGDWLYIGYI